MPDADAAKELINLLIETAKDSLVDSTGDETLRLQGEARAFKRLYTLITRAPMKTEEQ